LAKSLTLEGHTHVCSNHFETAIDELLAETSALTEIGRPTTPSDIKMMQEIADQLTAMSASLSSRAEQFKDLTTSP
jgi:hypothetical protein